MQDGRKVHAAASHLEEIAVSKLNRGRNLGLPLRNATTPAAAFSAASRQTPHGRSFVTALVFGEHVLQVVLDDPGGVIASQLDRVHAGHRRVSGVADEVDVLRIGALHNGFDVLSRLEARVQMSVNAELHAQIRHALAKLIEGNAHLLVSHLLVARRASSAEIDLEMVASESLDEVHQLHVIFDHSRPLAGVHKVGPHRGAVGNGLQLEVEFVQRVLQPLRVLLPTGHIGPECLDPMIADLGRLLD